jgi:hypothetical protein
MVKLCNNWNENYKMLISHTVVNRAYGNEFLDHNSALRLASKVNQYFERASLEDYLRAFYFPVCKICMKNCLILLIS